MSIIYRRINAKQGQGQRKVGNSGKDSLVAKGNSA